MSSVYPITSLNRTTCDIKESRVTKTSRVGIIGGSFDPPSVVHMIIGSELLNLDHVDEIWYVPCGEREDRKLADGKIRLEMLEASIKSFFWGNPERVKILDVELKNQKMMQTYDLLCLLRSENADKELFFVMGAELLEHLTSWEHGLKLKQNFNFMVIDHPCEVGSNPCIPPKSQNLNLALRVDMSWEDVQARIKKSYKMNSMGLEGIIEKDVLDIIRREKLYKD